MMSAQTWLANWESIGLYWLVVWTLAATAVWAGATGLAVCLRRHSAQARHRVWAISMIVVLVAPLVAPFLPVPRWWKWSNEGDGNRAADTRQPGHVIAVDRAADAKQNRSATALSNEQSATANHVPVADARHVMPPPSSIGTTKSRPAIDETRPRPVSWRSTLIAAWLGGAALRFLVFAAGLWRIRLLRRRAVSLTDGPEMKSCRELCRLLGIRRNVRLLIAPQAHVPFLAGIIDSAIVLPAGYGRWAPERLRVVLTHELLHLKRNDVFWEIIAQFAMVPAWFHPLGWLATRRLRVERELACDDAVLLSGEQPADYAEQLVGVAAELRGRAWRPAPVVAMAGASPIERRVRSILDPRVWRAPLGRWRTVGLSLGMAGLVLAVAALSPSIGGDKPASPAVAAEPLTTARANDKSSPETIANDQQIIDELEKSTTLQLDNSSLEDALMALSKRHGIPICIHVRSFADAGAIGAPNITLKADGIKLRDAIKSLVETATGDTKAEMAVEANQGTLQISVGKVADNRQNDSREPGGDRMTTVRGIVHCVDGSPAAYCEIIARTVRQTTVLCANKDGAFAIAMQTEERAGPAILIRSADGQQLGTLTFRDDTPNDQDSAPLNLTLQSAKSITVVVTDGAGNPIPQAHVAITGTQGAFDKTNYQGLTDVAGRFAARMPEKLEIGYIFAFKPAAGLDYHSYVKSPRSSDLQVKPPKQPAALVQLTLADVRAITIKYIDDDGQPIAGLAVYPWIFNKPGESDDLNISGVPWFQARTSASGEVTFDWIPKWNDQQIIFWPSSSNRFTRGERVSIDPKEPPKQPLVVTLDHLVELSGVVRDAAGKPFANAFVDVSGKSNSLGEFRGGTKTDQEARYRIEVPPHSLYMLAAYSDDKLQASAMRDGIPVYPGKPVSGLDLTLRPATRFFGRLTLGPTNKPIRKYYIFVYEYGRDLNNMKEVSYIRDANMVHSVQTDAQGRFEFHLGPGKYEIRGTEQDQVTKFEITDQKELEFNFHSERPDRGILRGAVVTRGSSASVPRAHVWGVTEGGYRDIEAVANSEGEFEVMRDLHPAVLFACTEDRSLGGIVEIDADEQKTTIPIAATANYTARIVDKAKKLLSSDRKITFGVTVYSDPKKKTGTVQHCFGDTIQPDQEGRVRFKGLVVGATYDVYLHNLDGHSSNRIAVILPKESGDHDLGELVAAPPESYRPPTFEERVAQAFERPISAVERNRDARNFARLADAHVFITFANPQAPQTKKLFKLYFDGDLWTAVNDDYHTMAIPTTGPKREQAAALAKELGVELPNDDMPLIAAESIDGKVLGVLTGSNLVTKENEISEQALLAFVKQHALPRLDGRKLFDDALAQAKRENKRVLVDETAVWCGPCHMLATLLDKNREIWEKDFLWIKMDPRWPQAAEIMKSLRKDAEGGYPWFAILDADGKVLATSNKSDGANIGFPSEPDSNEHFLHMLKTTAQRLTDEDFARLKSALEIANRGM